jgi:hypothetical protein
MKNLLNIALVASILIVLGCKCQQTLDEIKNASQSPSPTASASPSATKSDSSTTNSTKNDSSKSDTGSGTGVSKASFDKMRIGMTLDECNEIIGFDATEMTRNTGGGKVFTSVKWEGKDYAIITAVFKDDILTNKYEANLK